jgi:hypothetical protein
MIQELFAQDVQEGFDVSDSRLADTGFPLPVSAFLFPNKSFKINS